MSKVYIVISAYGEYDDYLETVEKVFADRTKAQNYVIELEDQERGYKCMANKCKECGGQVSGCPFYAEPVYNENGCENYNPYYDETRYYIMEEELEE